MLSIGKISHRIMEQGRDQSKLGRWAWVKYRDKHGRTFRVVTVYRPRVSISSNSAYLQQARALAIGEENICLRQSLLNNLGEI